MTSPTALYVVGLADFVRLMVLVWLALTVAWASFEVSPAPWAVALFVTWPASRSAWVIVYVFVQLTVAFVVSAVEAPPQSNAVPLLMWSSVTVNWAGPIVTLPVFLIVYVYLIPFWRALYVTVFGYFF